MGYWGLGIDGDSVVEEGLGGRRFATAYMNFLRLSNRSICPPWLSRSMTKRSQHISC